MSTKAQKANKKRLAKQSKEIQGPRAELPSQHGPEPSRNRGLIDRIANPMMLVGFGVVAGIVGVVFSTPVLVVSEISILMAVYRSGILRGRGSLYQLNAYAILILLSATVFLAAEAVAKKPVRDYVRQMARDAAPQPKIQNGSVAAPASLNSIPMPAQAFHSLGVNQQPMEGSAKVGHRSVPDDQPRPDSPEGALVRQMRQRLTRDAGDPEKIKLDVQWMREQFEAGWQAEPPEMAQKHEAETEETAKLILAAASNRRAILQLLPHITIDK